MDKSRFLRRLGVTAAAVILIAGAVGCGNSDGETAGTQNTEAPSVALSGVWARASLAGNNTAIYLTIKGGESDDQLLSANASVLADSVELHETTMADPTSDNSEDPGSGDSMHGDGTHSSPSGQMRTMRQVEMIDIPAGGSVELAPGGFHIMVMNLESDLVVGDRFPVTLTFKKAGELTTTAEVKES